MRIGRVACMTALAAVATYSVAMAGVASAATAPGTSGAGSASEFARVCPPVATPGVASCNAIQLLNPAANWKGVQVPAKGPNKGHGGGGGTTTSFPGYTAPNLQAAYNLSEASAALGGGETVAVVDAYDDPNAAADLAVYRNKMGLPSLCGAALTPTTSCSGSFTKENQSGAQNSPPTASTSWSEEISLDLDMVSAICPNCNILLVEATSSTISDLAAAEGTALAGTGVDAVSNSYGGSESQTTEHTYNSAYSSNTAAITVSAGDSGYGVEFPAAAPSVVAVGGTTLTSDSPSMAAGSWSQTVWSGTGSGCSAFESIPSWQPSTSLCAKRTVADVAADANPSTGVAVYDTFGESGWLVFGGTSVASPIVASVFALAGYSGTSSAAAEGLYTGASVLTKVTSGSNARHCSDYLCNAADSLGQSSKDPGYNGPTGNGTPNGLSGF